MACCDNLGVSIKKNVYLKRIEKYCRMFKDLYNINVGHDVSKNIVWCNGGLGCGLSREDVVEFFSQFGEISNVILLQNKSYCFISYKNLPSAIRCMSNANLKHHQAASKFRHLMGVLYLLHADQVPSLECASNVNPSGLIMREEFISPEEELKLMKFVNNEDEPWLTLKHRKIKHYGYEFCYSDNKPKKTENTKVFPSCIDFILKRIKDMGLPMPLIPDQLTINLYEPGQGIPVHVDTHSAFEEYIYIVSLNSSVEMEFRQGAAQAHVYIPQRSLFILSSESRYAWTHGIICRTKDTHYDETKGYVALKRGTRISLTFRCVRNEPCNCVFKRYCDSKISNANQLSKVAVTLERKYVQQTYSEIADHFSDTRHKPWPNVVEFIRSLPEGSLLLDVGCGNGKYLGTCGNVVELGVELCPSLAKICRDRGHETVNCNCLALPFVNNMFDGIICVAVIHHLSTLERRQRAVLEILRVLVSGGRALIYVWATQQSQVDTDDEVNYETVAVANIENIDEGESISLPVEANDGSNFRRKDILVPWKTTQNNETRTFMRFYHIFDEDELKELCQLTKAKIIKIYFDTGNWCVVITK